MNGPESEAPSHAPSNPTRDEPALDWTHGDAQHPAYRDNLIYLPFAAHLAEEDAAVERKAA